MGKRDLKSPLGVSQAHVGTRCLQVDGGGHDLELVEDALHLVVLRSVLCSEEQVPDPCAKHVDNPDIEQGQPRDVAKGQERPRELLMYWPHSVVLPHSFTSHPFDSSCLILCCSNPSP